MLNAFTVDDPWMRVNFMLTGDARLGGERPIDLLRNGKIDDVVTGRRLTANMAPPDPGPLPPPDFASRDLPTETVRLMFRLARVGADDGPMGSRQIADYLNLRGIRTQTGGRWGVGAVHQVLTRETYIGRHRFNVTSWRKKEQKPADEVVESRALRPFRITSGRSSPQSGSVHLGVKRSQVQRSR